MEGHPADQCSGRRPQKQAGVLHPQQPSSGQRQVVPPGPEEWRPGDGGGAGLRDRLCPYARRHGNDFRL